MNKDEKIVLITVSLASFLTPFMGSSINVALPSIGKEFMIDAVYLSWIATSFLLTAAIFLLPFGRLADIIGRKKLFILGIIIYTFSSLLSALSFSKYMLVAARLTQGIGSAMMFGNSMAILTSIFPPEKRGRVLGIATAAVYLGLSIGPFWGGILTHYLGWRSIFIINFLLGLLIYIMFLRLKGEWAEAKGEKFDIIGSIIYAVSIPLVILGFTSINTIKGMILLTLGLIGFFLFYLWESKNKFPILNISVFKKNRVFMFSNLAALINYCASFSVAYLISLYLQYVKGFDPRHTGLILISQPIVMCIFSPLAGRLSDKISPRILSTIGMAVMCVGLFFFIFISQETSVAFIVCNLIIIGIGFGIFSSPNTNAVMSSIEKKYLGVASSTLGTMRIMGQVFSMGIATLVLIAAVGKVQITPEYFSAFIKSLKIDFIIFFILCFLGIFASLARGKTNNS